MDKVEAGEAIGRGYYCGHGGHGYGGGCGGRGGHLAKVEEVSVVAVVVAMATIAVPNTLCSQWQVFAAFSSTEPTEGLVAHPRILNRVYHFENR